jgi:hypothetical protein
MVVYKCHKCNNKFDQKSHYEKHLERKYSCVPEENIMKCNYCGFECERENILNKHIKYRCSIKKDLEKEENNEDRFNKLEEQIKLLQSQLAQQSGTIHSNAHNTNTTNTNCNNNTANTINNTTNTTNSNNTQYVMVNFGQENIDLLSNNEKREILNSSYAAVINCMKKMNFNPNIPEQNNVFITNPKAEFAYKLENGVFVAIMTKDVIEQLIKHRTNDVRDLIEQNDVLKVSAVKIERVNNLIKIIDEEKDIEDMKKEIKLALFNQNKGALVNKEKVEGKKTKKQLK